MNSLSHIKNNQQPGMVDIQGMKVTQRSATARSLLIVESDLNDLLENGDLKSPKGSVFATAIIAGTLAAKRTGDLIPFCHPVGMENCDFNLRLLDEKTIEVLCTCEVSAKTGIEMEALVGASVAALTLYDMLKALKVEMVISETRLIKKSGGKTDYQYVAP